MLGPICGGLANANTRSSKDLMKLVSQAILSKRLTFEQNNALRLCGIYPVFHSQRTHLCQNIGFNMVQRKKETFP